MSSDVVIKVENLSKCYQIYDKPRDRLLQMIHRGRKQYYREFWALKDVSFEVRRGESVGIVGRNGSGKSTLLQLICGTLNPTSGSIKTHGRIAALLELGSGFNPDFTGKENVYMNGIILGLTKEEIDDRFDDIVKFADIGNFVDQPVKTYSSGMYVRLAFAVIAHADADILIVDEALAVGDAFFVQKCMRFLRNFMKTGTILFVSHDTGAVVNLSSHAIWLKQGTVVKRGEPKDIAEHYLANLYEDQQGQSAKVISGEAQKNTVPVCRRDMRADFINASSLRNDIELFEFNTDASFFGKGDAQIVSVCLLDETNNKLTWMVGGESVILSIECKTEINIVSPIVGFIVKDRLGQTLFGDNTYLTYLDEPIEVRKGNVFEARFNFFMPILPKGTYSISATIAEGSQDEHIQQHWVHDALVFESHSSSVSTGLVGVPMSDIKFLLT